MPAADHRVGEEESQRETPGEARVPRSLRQPRDPTGKERSDHEAAGHATFRSWCDSCVRGRGEATPHRTWAGQEYHKPQIGAGYWFAGGTDQMREDLAVLVLYEKTCKCLFGDVVGQKGATELNIELVLSYLDATGFKEVVFKTDGENPSPR